MHTSECPFEAAIWSGVSPVLLLGFLTTSFSSNILQTFEWPLLAARWRGVLSLSVSLKFLNGYIYIWLAIVAHSEITCVPSFVLDFKEMKSAYSQDSIISTVPKNSKWLYYKYST